MSDRVLLTGISGFLGGHVGLALLNKGYQVRGSVRNLSKADKVRKTLADAGADVSRLEFVALDLLSNDGWTEAAADCRFLAHTASPFVLSMPKDKDELIRPAVEGTRRAINAGLAAGVERIVLTSSTAAIQYGHGGSEKPVFSEADWSRIGAPDVTAYAESKTRAEQEAWALMRAAHRETDLAVINPAAILGPLLDDDPGTSGKLVLRLLNGTVPAAPRLHLGFVDVRDVADMHVAALETPDAGGKRFIGAEDTRSFWDVSETLRTSYPQYARRRPRFEMPDWLVRLYALFDSDVRSNVDWLGVVRTLDNRAGRTLLGRPFIPVSDSVLAMAKTLVDQGLVKA